MDEQEEPGPEPAPGRRWLGWTLVALGAAGGLWLAALPLDPLLPEPRARRSLTPDPPAPAAVAPEGAPPLAAPERGAEVAPPDVSPDVDEASPPGARPPGEWFEAAPGEEVEEEPPAQDALRARLERQLLMNDLRGVRVEIVGDRIVTSGALADPGDRQRVALLVRSLAPGFVHEDHLEAGGAR